MECLPEDSTLIDDKAYDSSTFRQTAAAKGVKTCIPGRANRTTPAGSGHSGLAWTEGTLWVAHYEERKIYQIDLQTGTVLRSIETTRFVCYGGHLG